jgi:hypothetical protein
MPSGGIIRRLPALIEGVREDEMDLPGAGWRQLVAHDVSAPKQYQQSRRIQLEDLTRLRWAIGRLSAFSLRERHFTHNVEIAGRCVRGPTGKFARPW